MPADDGKLRATAAVRVTARAVLQPGGELSLGSEDGIGVLGFGGVTGVWWFSSP